MAGGFDSRFDSLDRRLEQVVDATTAATKPAHIMDFATNPAFLGKDLFPAQGTLLKVLSLSTELFTDHDYAVIADWCAGTRLEADGHVTRWVGTEGTPGDLLERIEWCRENGQQWFREALLILGRRGSKGYVTAIMSAWVLWSLLSLGNPQRHHGLDVNKRLRFVVFAGTKAQAIANQFRDLAQLVKASHCFDRFHPHFTSSSFVLFTPAQLAAGVDTSDPDNALIEIRAGETTALAARGPSVPMLIMDEFAHLLGAGSTASSTELYEAANPAREEFGADSLVIQTSSPWDKYGQLWESYCRACTVDGATGQARDPDFFTLQLPSWGLYRAWERANTIPMWPDGPNYPAQLKPVIEYNDRLRRKQAANPDAFAREHLAQWRSNLAAYLPAEFVARPYAPYKGDTLHRQEHGNLGTVYVAHGDPSLSGANFGFAIGHIERDEDDVPHIVADVTHHWSPSEFPDGIINYDDIEDAIVDYIKRFRIETLTFDQWNSAGSIRKIQTRADAAGLPYKTRVFKRDATQNFNWDSYEILKTAIGHNIVHLPDDDKLTRRELEALQLVNGKVVAPTVGDVRTKDIADALANVTYTLIGDDSDALFDRLSGLSPRLSNPGPAPRRDQELADLFTAAGRRGLGGFGARRGASYDPSRGTRRGSRGW